MSSEIYSRTFQPILANTVTVLQLNMKNNNLHICKTNLLNLLLQTVFLFYALRYCPH